MVVFDASILLFVLDPNTSSSVPQACRRVEHLIDTLSRRGDVVIIPTPVLTECLIRAGAAGSAWLDLLQRAASIRIAPFDERAAMECAAQLAHVWRWAGERSIGSTETKRKVKFDSMIIATAIVERADSIYSDDEALCRNARQAGLVAFRLAELDLPPEDAQPALPLEPPDAR